MGRGGVRQLEGEVENDKAHVGSGSVELLDSVAIS